MTHPPSVRVHGRRLHVAFDRCIVTADVPALAGQLRGLLISHPIELVECDVSGLVDIDLDTVNGLARLSLIARRHGCAVRLVRPPGGLDELVDLAGLCRALPNERLVVQGQGQAEEGEHPGGVEERVETDDPAP